MSHASEEHINQQEAEQMKSSINALPSPMSQAQNDYILQLLDFSILATHQKDQIQELLQEGNLTMDHANRIIEALLQQQNNPLNMIRDGRTMKMKDLNKAIRKTCNDPNT